MEKNYDELNEVKIEMEKLKEECLAKTKLSESLRKAHVEQLAKNQQSKLEMEKLARELSVKSMEISEIRQMCEELQCSLHKKDIFLREISSANEKLRVDHSEKIITLEGVSRDLALALDEASARVWELEEKSHANSEEIVRLKRLLSIEPEKIVEVKKNASKERKDREEYILRIEEEVRILRNELKWKHEQFTHLEEAHGKLQSLFTVSKVEWQEEKSLLSNEMSSLQANLDAQIQISEHLETQLRVANEALAHEESKRKVLEVQLSECRSQFDNVFQECCAAKSGIEELAMKRDEEISELQMQMRRKEALSNEMKHRTVRLEQENNNLLGSLKAMQEAELTKTAPSSSLEKLQNKLQGLEQLHGKCAVQLKEKEADWNSQTEELTRDMKCVLSELDRKNERIRRFQKELEDCQWLLEVKDEETFVLIMMLKSEFSVAYSKVHDAQRKLDMNIKQIEEKNMALNQQLQLKNTELQNVHAELKHRYDETAVLMRQVESSEPLKQKCNLLEEEIRAHKLMLKESKQCQCQLEQRFREECEQQEKTQNALEIELASKTSEIEDSRLELQRLKSEVESLRKNLEEIQEAQNQEKAGHFVTLKEIGKLKEHIFDLESEISEKLTLELLNEEKKKYLCLAEDRSCSIENLKSEIARLENELAEKEAGKTALLEALNTLEQDNKKHFEYVAKKDLQIQELQKQLESQEETLKTKMSEIEGKNQRMANLENCLEVHVSHKKALLESLTKSSVDNEYLIGQLEGIFGQIHSFCEEDVELRDLLGKLQRHSEEVSDPERNLPSGGNDWMWAHSRNPAKVIFDKRTPLTELNCWLDSV